MAAPPPAAALIASLREHPPFDEMGPGSMQFLAERLRLAYYARSSPIVGPHSGKVDCLYIVKQGSVRGTPAAGSARAAADIVLGAGECFPLGALIARRATVYSYRAQADTFCWELPAADFHHLLERSRRFHAFCTNYLASLVDRSYRALRVEAAESSLDAAGMLAPLRTAFSRAPVSCAPETPVAEALKAMHAARVGSMVVLDVGQVPIGIFTTPDVLERVALPQLPTSTPIAEVMTRDPVCLEEEATLADAALAMARHAIRHVVVTRDGRLTGVVSERDLFALQRLGLRRTSERVRGAQTRAELVQAAGEIRQVARHLLAQGVGAEALTAMVSALNDVLSQRLLELAAARRELPGAWCWLALGSEGRMEQTFATDQDNALMFAPEGEPEAARRAFLDFAEEVNRALDACGFPLCKGEVMARNPRWCLTPLEWRAVFDDWIRNNDAQALLNASIFFDFRALWGDARLAGALRESVLEQTRANRTFCRAMAETALQVRPPLGLLADFSVQELDLKGLGARPIVDAARVLALAQGLAETGTAARLRAVGEPTAVEAFHYIQSLRLKHGNRVRVAALGRIDRRILKEAFRQAALLQERLRLDYGL
jgi:CBS domain-containing protein